MSLSAVETAVVEYVGDVLVNRCGRPIPDRVLRYHGTLPHDCCTEAGFLVVSWEPQVAARAVGGQPCAGPLIWTLALRYVTCWPTPEANATGVELIDDSWDATAAMLTDVAQCVAAALVGLMCAVPPTGDPLMDAVLGTVLPKTVQYVDTQPIRAEGMCAGVAWRIAAAPLAIASSLAPAPHLFMRSASDTVGMNVS